MTRQTTNLSKGPGAVQTQSDSQPAPVTPSPAAAGTTAALKGPLPTDPQLPGSGSRGAGPVAEPEKEWLCKAYVASQDKQHGKQMDATVFERLAEAAGARA
jgi:hypothetical protein